MNKKIVWIVIVIILLFISFYSGMVLGKNQTTTSTKGISTYTGYRGTRGSGVGNTGNGVLSGQIIYKDSQSITVSLVDGSSKIIFLDNSTPITKSVSGNLTDLVVGTNVLVIGANNSDGSINATSVQIRPNIQKPTGGGQNMVQ